jgi:hypothetical protein
LQEQQTVVLWPALFAVVANGFHRTALESLLAELGFLFILSLLKHVRITTLVITVKIIGSYLAAGVTVNACVIHIEFAFCIVFVF